MLSSVLEVLGLVGVVVFAGLLFGWFAVGLCVSVYVLVVGYMLGDVS